MTPQQLSSLLVGFAQAQAAVVKGIESALDKASMPETAIAAQKSVHDLIWRGHESAPQTDLQNISAKLLEIAILNDDEELLKRLALADSIRLLGT